METFPNVIQYPFVALQEKGAELKGKWNESFFRNNHPIVIELGCGKGEYAVGLGTLFPEKNFIGIDIKGARMWTGAKQAQAANLNNVAFLRTHIEMINYFFEEGEVSEIWITFPDPQMRKINKRMTSARFMESYCRILGKQGIIHLKTDSNFMYTYTGEIIKANRFPVSVQTDDLYHSHWVDEVLSIRTFYEQQWIDRGLTIKYIQFICESRENYVEPNVEIKPDNYRSFNRGKREMYDAVS